jgi:hypothetical protein
MKARATMMGGLAAAVMALALVPGAGCNFTKYKKQAIRESQGAGPEGERNDSGQPSTFAWLDANVFQPKCATCHFHSKDFVDYDTVRGLGGWVVAGIPEDSALYALTADGSMPKRAPKLSQAEIDAIYDWIKNGAPER